MELLLGINSWDLDRLYWNPNALTIGRFNLQLTMQECSPRVFGIIRVVIWG